MKYIVDDIQYDTDGDTQLAETLPQGFVVECETPDDIADAISDATGFCVFGFRFTPEY